MSGTLSRTSSREPSAGPSSKSPAAPSPSALLGAALLLLAGGCASNVTVSPLTQARNDVIRELTTACYWEREGERYVYGGHRVHAACRQWARDVVAVRMPDGPRVFD